MHGPIGLEYDKGAIREFVPAWHIPEFLKVLERLSKGSVFNDPPKDHPHEEAVETARLTALARSWIRLLRRVRSSAHGGAFLILPERIVLENEAINIKYPIQRLNFAHSALKRGEWDYYFADLRLRAEDGQLTEKEREQFDAFLNEVLLADKEVAHVTDAIAGMSNLDGAVLFSSDLEVLGFGTRIHVRSEIANHEVELASVSGGNGGSQLMHTFGLRHLSAYEFVSLNEGGIAFVVSQDGGIRAFTSQPGKVMLYDCIELTDAEISINLEEFLDQS